MSGLLGLDLANPVLAAPMSGGPGTPAMVVAASRAGSMGFLAAGYKTTQLLAEQIAQVRTTTDTFGVNLFAPNALPVDPGAYRTYAVAIQVEGDLYGLDLAGSPAIEDDDHWQAKIDLLLADPVPVVSFTFGIPGEGALAALRKAGSLLVQTVTSAEEARLAATASVDALAVQGPGAGGHSATVTPRGRSRRSSLPELVRQVRGAVDLPIVAAGGLATPEEVAAVLRAGAEGVMVGTVLLRTYESGASSAHKAALAQRTGVETIVTRAFSGRPARALPNEFTSRYDRLAPFGFPAVHHLTSPLRVAAASAGDPERINLWAGTGYQHAFEESTTQTLLRLSEQL